MKKLLIILAIAFTSISCEKDDIDDCECYFYPKMNEYANCEFESSSFRKSLERAYFPEDIQRIRELALYNFKCK